jgi:hypothetical protein
MRGRASAANGAPTVPAQPLGASMPSGGARPRSGPEADPNALRRFRKDDQKTWTDLDPAGYKGPVPPYPFDPSAGSEFAHPSDSLNAELEMWAGLWVKPQAAMWAKLGMENGLAMYVRSFLEASKPGAPSSMRTAVLRMEAELGVSIVGMRGLRWRLKSDDLAAAREEKQAKTTKGRAPARQMTARERRLKAVGDGS